MSSSATAKTNASATEEDLTAILDKMSDTKGLSNLSDSTEDWTDVKHSERKKRDRILADGVVMPPTDPTPPQNVSGYGGVVVLSGENIAISGGNIEQTALDLVCKYGPDRDTVSLLPPRPYRCPAESARAHASPG